MILKHLKIIFLLFLIVPTTIMLSIWYGDYKFKNSPLDEKILYKIESKEREILKKVKDKFDVDLKIPLIVSDEITYRLYGVATYSKDGEIAVILNKKNMKESLDYVVHEVMPHEYAHALMFYLGEFDPNDGHSKRWQEICFALGGKKCERFVDNRDIVLEKIKRF